MRITTKTRDEKLVDRILSSPVDVAQRRFRRRLIGLLLLATLIVIIVSIIGRFTGDSPEAYDSPPEHFKYGSIGSEPGGQISHPVGGVLPPAEIFAILPDMFPDRLPGGYPSLGLLYEPGRDFPIGVSQRKRFGIKLAGLNCAVCHAGTVRTSEHSTPMVVLGMPAHQLDLQRLFRFTLNAILDARFTTESVVAAIERRFGNLDSVDRLILKRQVIPQLRERTLLLQSRIGRLLGEGLPEWGPGRVDTFNPYKALQFNWPLERIQREELIAASDFPAIWNQKVRVNMNLHWDGNNRSLAERNLSAGLGAGITPVTADHPSIERVAAYLMDLPPPAWPSEFPLNMGKAATGREVFRHHCASCHDLNGERIGHVEAWENVRTDRQRLDSYTAEFAGVQNTLFADTSYRFKNFRKTNGYSNQPLDGIWARAPYLHNGSVPTLADLLEPIKRRPKKFYRGCDLYDPVKIGFVSNRQKERGRTYFEYDTALLGNSNAGHEYGVDLHSDQKDQLLEYLKTL